MKTNSAVRSLTLSIAFTAFVVPAFASPKALTADTIRGDSRTRIEVAPPVVELPKTVARPTSSAQKDEAEVSIAVAQRVGPSSAAVINKQRPGLLVCWQLARWSDSARKKATVEFRLGANGRPTDVVVRTRSRQKRLESCLALKVSEWRLPTAGSSSARYRVDL